MPITIKLSQIEEIYHICGKSDIITVTFRTDFVNGCQDVTEVVSDGKLTDEQIAHYKQAVINHRNGRL